MSVMLRVLAGCAGKGGGGAEEVADTAPPVVDSAAPAETGEPDTEPDPPVPLLGHIWGSEAAAWLP